MSKVWNQLTPFQRGWLLALSEGEAAFSTATSRGVRRPRLALQMNDPQPVKQFSEYIGKSCWKRLSPRDITPTYCSEITGRQAAELMAAMYSWLSARRKEQVHGILLKCGIPFEVRDGRIELT